MSDPELSVCMPVYNSVGFVRQAVDQILAQTFHNFRFIITDDCSDDGTYELLQEIHDPRILLFRNDSNMGTVPTRNTMIDYCLNSGFQYMALMDADDRVFPQRLEKQLAILEQDPSLAVCGSSMKIERTGGIWHAPSHPAEIKSLCIFGNPIPTSTAMINLRYIEMYSLRWDKAFAPCADYHLWYRFLFEHNLRASSTGDVDMIYTYTPTGVSHGRGLAQQEMKDTEVKRLILKQFSLDYSHEEVYGFMKIALYRSSDKRDGRSYYDICQQLKLRNNDKIVSSDIMNRMISHRAFVYIRKCRDLDPDLRQRIKKDLVLPHSAIFTELENKLINWKQNVLDRYCPVLSYYLAFIYKKAVKIIIIAKNSIWSG